MISILKYRKKTTVTRNLPENIIYDDVHFFKNELKKSIPKVYLFKLKRVTLINYDLKLFGFLNVFQNQTHFYKFNKIQRIKNILRGCFTLFHKLEKRSIKAGVWISDDGGMNYFHWITDCLTRLVFAKNNLKIKEVILPISFKNLDYVVDSLKILDFTAIFYEPNVKIFIKELFLPTKTAPTGNYSEDLIELKNLLISKSSIYQNLNYEKIYISRKYSTIRSLSNEEEIINFLATKGFKVLYAEELSLNEQTEIFSSCKTLISLHGAGLTNQIFMPENSKVIELRLEDQQKNNAYFSLSNLFNIKYFYVSAEKVSCKNGLILYSVDKKQIKKLINSAHSN